MAMRKRWLLYVDECQARGKPLLAPVPEEGGLIAAAPAPDDGARNTKTLGGAGSVAETPRVSCPAMPVGPPGLAVRWGHLVADPSQPLLAMVARAVTRPEITTTPAASQSLTDEAA